MTANPARLDETIAWLSWYFSWPVLSLAALGLAAPGLAALGLVRRPVAPPGLAFAGLLLAVVGLQYLYHPLEPGLQIGSMRRYVPVVLPLTMLFAALTAVGLLARVPAGRYRAGLTLAAGALLVGLVARPSLAVVGQPLWDARLAPVARLFPERAVVLLGPDLAGTHIATSLAYLHDLDAVLVQQANPDGAVLRRAIGDWLADGRPVFLVAGRYEFSFFAPDLALAAVGGTQVDLRLLETTRGPGPAGRRADADRAAVLPGHRDDRPRPAGRRRGDARQRPAVQPGGLPCVRARRGGAGRRVPLDRGRARP